MKWNDSSTWFSINIFDNNNYFTIFWRMFRFDSTWESLVSIQQYIRYAVHSISIDRMPFISIIKNLRSELMIRDFNILNKINEQTYIVIRFQFWNSQFTNFLRSIWVKWSIVSIKYIYRSIRSLIARYGTSMIIHLDSVVCDI